ncbi:uncharacterized protein LOC143913613 isoform X1 [Arctopsyche grandis]|uniref:uncharacterized protein LOC143913613 isoform X1 n=1 Tax=Arctopsyche grandis TaxID=121162 RepID=UPI00406D7C35
MANANDGSGNGNEIGDSNVSICELDALSIIINSRICPSSRHQRRQTNCDSETKSGTSIILYGTSDSGSENKNRGWAMLSEMSNGEAASSITDFSSDSWTNG